MCSKKLQLQLYYIYKNISFVIYVLLPKLKVSQQR